MRLLDRFTLRNIAPTTPYSIDAIRRSYVVSDIRVNVIGVHVQLYLKASVKGRGMPPRVRTPKKTKVGPCCRMRHYIRNARSFTYRYPVKKQNTRFHHPCQMLSSPHQPPTRSTKRATFCRAQSASFCAGAVGSKPGISLYQGLDQRGGRAHIQNAHRHNPGYKTFVKQTSTGHGRLLVLGKTGGSARKWSRRPSIDARSTGHRYGDSPTTSRSKHRGR